MIETIIRTAIQRASTIVNAEEYLIRLRAHIESNVRHQIKLHGGHQNYNVNSRFHLGFSDVDGFYQEVRTNIICSQNGKEITDTVRSAIGANHPLSNLRGIFQLASIKAKSANDFYFSNGEIHGTKAVVETELGALFGNHKAIVVINHSRSGNCAVDVELIQSSMKSLTDMFGALESGFTEDSVVA